MYKVACLSILSIALVSLTGCGDNADSLTKQAIKDMNAMAGAIESGASESEIESIVKRM